VDIKGFYRFSPPVDGELFGPNQPFKAIPYSLGRRAEVGDKYTVFAL
jgi:hypothetical protein